MLKTYDNDINAINIAIENNEFQHMILNKKDLLFTYENSTRNYPGIKRTYIYTSKKDEVVIINKTDIK